ncbi:DEKNAAC101644 [Brettanomyces naardenensis]|uniref:Serine/threonine-protein kinase RIO1 n=1 Tax=Brettanomyces naardenensis TaxID=13370 RepID=A0A448YID4_BRENA|nr:DEKNAAC101644 [Brettanomyces naardenensis]
MTSDDYSSDYAEDEAVQSRSSTLRETTDLLDRYSDKINLDQYLGASHRTTRDKSERATVDQVLDPRTVGFLGKLFKNGTITRINGCISTGKEANVYHAVNENNGREYAVKIYKTSILVFKDRERYVDGEFRFRNTKSQSNPRKMVRTWAEKEFRNLKRLYSSGIPSPEPIDLKSHVLVMEYLTKGEGQPSPKLKDYQFKDLDEVVDYYQRMLVDMRLMFQKCRLIHADLSEYNTIVHKDDLYIFDVSQSVEPEHPMAMDFLRMDIKNVNDYFSRVKKINVYPERLIFRYIIDPWGIIDDTGKVEVEDRTTLKEYLNGIPLKSDDEKENQQDEIFRSLHLVTSLHNLEERDFQRFREGHVDTLVDLVRTADLMTEDDDEEEVSTDEENEEGEEEGSENENDDDSSDHTDSETPSKLKRFEDKDDKKKRKQAAKEKAREKRKTKMNKNVKKRLVKKSHKH